MTRCVAAWRRGRDRRGLRRRLEATHSRDRLGGVGGVRQAHVRSQRKSRGTQIVRGLHQELSRTIHPDHAVVIFISVMVAVYRTLVAGARREYRLVSA